MQISVKQINLTIFITWIAKWIFFLDSKYFQTSERGGEIIFTEKL